MSLFDLEQSKNMTDWKTAIEVPEPSISGRTLDESRVFTPQRRPAYPLLTIIDDQSTESGEVIRIRKSEIDIGRNEGDLTFPGEALMSSRHARIALQEVRSNRWVWVLEDLNSRHGVFLKLSEFELQPGNEFIMGGTKVLFHGDFPVAQMSSKPLLAYEPFFAEPSAIKPRLTLQVSTYSITHPEQHIPLTGKGLKLGRLVSGAGMIAIDPFLEPHHATMLRNSAGAWQIKDQKSLNGIWLRVKSVILSQPSIFLLGEQRFSFK